MGVEGISSLHAAIPSKFLPAVHDAVPYRADFVKAFNHAGLIVRQSLQYQFNRLCVIRHGRYGGNLLPAVRTVYELAAIDTDSFT